MKFSFRKNAIFALFVILISLSVTSCMTEDNWIDWKTINEQWYNAHKNDNGYTLLTSGVSYKMLRYGNPKDGRPQDSVNSVVYINYEGRLYNDSIYGKGTDAGFYTYYLVSGIKEVIMKMHPGDSCEIRIPWAEGYGSDGSGTVIPPYSTLKFNVGLNSFYNIQ